MVFVVITLFPEMFGIMRDYGIVGRALTQHKAQLHLVNPRDFATDNYRRIDDRPFGGGPGMVMMAEPLAEAIAYAKTITQAAACKSCPVVYLSPQGTVFNEEKVQDYQAFDGMILLCGRYEGIDERILSTLVDFELSIGDYVLTGGELPAMVLMDALIRRLPQTMGDERSAVQDSFVNGLLDCPQYTRPVSFLGQDVPKVLLSGHHKNIERWRFFEQLKQTQRKRPDLFEAFVASSATLDKTKQKWLNSFLCEQSHT